jgi:acyl-CoA synthetase (AMP-forming)/AMP-acid ligase II
MCRPGDDRATIAATSGRVVPGVEIRIAPPASGGDEPQTGEILVRGYNVMAGYLDDPEATHAAIDDDGWFHTGDVGWLDEQGNLRITDRIKDLFIVGGFNVYPAEVEAVILTHPSVAAVAVVGAPDTRLGEIGVAFVVARQPIDGDELVAWCRERIANYKVPRRVHFVDALPVNASGKVTKFELRALLHDPTHEEPSPQPRD